MFNKLIKFSLVVHQPYQIVKLKKQSKSNNKLIIFKFLQNILKTMTHFKDLLLPFQNSVEALKLNYNEKVTMINQVSQKNYTLLTLSAFNDPTIPKNNPIPISLYFEHILLPKAEEDTESHEKNSLENFFKDFKNSIQSQLNSIQNLVAVLINEIEKCKPSVFLTDFSNGALVDPDKFRDALQNIISNLARDSLFQKNQLKKYKELFECYTPSYASILQVLQIDIEQIQNSFAKSIQAVSEILVNDSKAIPYTNGIDIHPEKNIFAAIGCEGGDLVIVNQITNKVIKKTYLQNNFGGGTQNCLWSPFGKKIMVSTMKNHSIYIFDEEGQKLINCIENTYSQFGYGAAWLSEGEVAIGYADGLVKFFDIEKNIEIWSMNLNGQYAWGMDCLSNSNLLVGDGCGSIYNINWKKKRIDWIKKEWHFCNYYIRCLKLNKDKTMLLTGSGDTFVKLMEVDNQIKKWEFKLKSYVVGISWSSNEYYVLALGHECQLVVLNSKTGNKLTEYVNLSSKSMSLRLNKKMNELLVGDYEGKIKKLQIKHN